MTEPWDEVAERQLQEEQRRDRERIEQDLRDVIEHAQKLGLPQADVKLLKWGCGISNR
jgi:hypothetical protein